MLKSECVVATGKWKELGKPRTGPVAALRTISRGLEPDIERLFEIIRFHPSKHKQADYLTTSLLNCKSADFWLLWKRTFCVKE